VNPPQSALAPPCHDLRQVQKLEHIVQSTAYCQNHADVTLPIQVMKCIDGLHKVLPEEQLNYVIICWQGGYRSLIFGIFKRYGVLGHDAEEAWQDLWLKVSGHLSKWGMPRKAEKGWLAVSAANMARKYRKKRHRQIQFRQEFVESGMARIAVESAGELDWTEFSEAVTAAIASLPFPQKKVIERYFFEGYSKAEIARDLGIWPNAVEGRLHRALRHLRKELGKLEADLLP
jgi:RNA polymerase sigma-70 factor, ECF subfamily